MTYIRKLRNDILNIMKGYVHNAHTSIVKIGTNNENPKIKFNCDTFLKYLNKNNNINSIEDINIVQRYAYYIIREKIINSQDKQERNGNSILMFATSIVDR